jgi:hypothetical protein
MAIQETDARAALLQMMPPITGDDAVLLDNLPEQFSLNVPYVLAERKHWSGAACMQMLQSYHGGPTTAQDSISHHAGWDDWRYLNHESFSADFHRLLVRYNFLPANYYPGTFILPNFQTGPEGGDFISKNREIVSEIDFKYFKAMLIRARSPNICRIHFTTDEYEMSEEMARTLDNSGHCLLMVGYDSDGFIFHDPWDLAKWGGSRGGPYIHISYNYLTHIRPLVNCCREENGNGVKLVFALEEPRQAMSQGLNVDIAARIEWPAFAPVFTRSYKLENLSARLFVDDQLSLTSSEIVDLDGPLLPGNVSYISWSLALGNSVGSFGVRAELKGTVSIPGFAWESLPKDETIAVRARSSIRLDVKSTAWFNAYGRQGG